MSAIRIYPESQAAMCAESAGKPYRPCNGSEGDHFVSQWCGTCERDYGMLKGLPIEECDDNRICDIIARTFGVDEDHPDYPTEWVFGKDGQPCCTAHVPEAEPLPEVVIKDEHTLDLFEAIRTRAGNEPKGEAACQQEP
ncbi:hypothetical protein [Massilia sp. TSP1-1-2]|uniref:hypothetical protein n=1 Tax=Massilia sp. TSP1-1-2 TaxID=2804649 RepID=UPI003CF45C04